MTLDGALEGILCSASEECRERILGLASTQGLPTRLRSGLGIGGAGRIGQGIANGGFGF